MLLLDRRILTHIDFLQPFLVLPIIIISYFLISEANEILAQKQIVYFFIGFGSFLFFFLLPIRKLEWLIPSFYWLGILLLISVEFFGVTKLGARRWLEIPFVHFTIQPSEIMKPAFFLMIAYLIKNSPPDEEGYGWRGFIILSFYILLPFFLIAKEPDLGTALILLIVGYGILFVIGINVKVWLSIALIVGISGPFLYNGLENYQKKRIIEFIGEKPSYHVHQSIIAIGSGGITGKPREEATQTHFKFLPIATSDFIFAYHVERFGFLGAFGLIALYLALVVHLLSLNYKLKTDYLSRVMTTAIAFMIFIYTSVNVSMTIGFAPVVGIPLPFFSYGGSSFITFMVLFGILQNLLAFRFDPTYKSVHYRN